MAKTKIKKPVTPPAQPEPKKSADRLTKERIEQLQIITSELSKSFEELLKFQRESRAESHSQYEKLFQMVVKKTHDLNNNFQSQTPEPKKRLTRDEAHSEIFGLLSFRTTLSTASKVKVLSDLMKVFVSDDDGNRKIKENDLRASFDRLKKEEAVTETIKEIFDL